MYGLSLLLVLVFAPRGFFSGYSGFPLFSNTNISKFRFDLDYCQVLYHEPLAREIVQLLPLLLTLNKFLYFYFARAEKAFALTGIYSHVIMCTGADARSGNCHSFSPPPESVSGAVVSVGVFRNQSSRLPFNHNDTLACKSPSQTVYRTWDKTFIPLQNTGANRMNKTIVSLLA